MSNIVIGKNVIAYVTVSSVDLGITCWSSVSFNFVNELIGKTDVNAGMFRKKRVRISDCSASVSGLLTIENEPGFVSGLWFLQESVRRSEIFIKFVYTDEASIIKEISGFFLVESIDMPVDISNFAEININLAGTGGIEISTIDPPSGLIPPVCEVEDTLYLTLAEGSDNVSDALLDQPDVVILSVSRSGLVHTQVIGTPGSMEFAFTGGDIYFAPGNPGNPGGEPVTVIYKIDG